MKEVLDFLKEAGVFFLATVDDEGARVRPMGFFMEYEGRLYFGIGSLKEGYAQLKKNPNFEVCALNSDKQWLRIKAKAVFDERPIALSKAFEVMPKLKLMFPPEGKSEFCLFYADKASCAFADMKGQLKICNL